MKYVFSLVVLLSGLTSYAADANTLKIKNITVSGKIAGLFVSAMKKAEVRPACKKVVGNTECEYKVLNFEASEEGDGCGGGTTSYSSNFNYITGASYYFRECAGLEDEHGFFDGKDVQSSKNLKHDIADDLGSLLHDLHLTQQAGWSSFVSAKSITCAGNKYFVDCKIVVEYNPANMVDEE